MKEVKTQNSKSYHEYLMSALQDSQRAQDNIEVALEAEDFDLQVLQLTIQDVVEACSKINPQPEILKQKHEQFDQILTKNRGTEIYALVELLDALGFKLTINAKSK